MLFFRIIYVILFMNLATVDSMSKDVITANIDHIIWAVPDLEAGAKLFEEMSGISPAFGGEHPGAGTANYLVSLGDKTYLEIIGPAPGKPSIKLGRVLAQLKEPRLISFAMRKSDMTSTAKSLKQAGLVPLGPSPGSRVQMDGSLLEWNVLMVSGHDFGGYAPFIIDWKKSIHPAVTSPKGVMFKSFKVEHPNAVTLKKIYDALGLEVDISQNTQSLMEAVLSSPKGQITLRGKGNSSFFEDY